MENNQKIVTIWPSGTVRDIHQYTTHLSLESSS